MRNSTRTPVVAGSALTFDDIDILIIQEGGRDSPKEEKQKLQKQRTRYKRNEQQECKAAFRSNDI